jgi:hypothetical protein
MRAGPFCFSGTPVALVHGPQLLEALLKPGAAPVSLQYRRGRERAVVTNERDMPSSFSLYPSGNLSSRRRPDALLALAQARPMGVRVAFPVELRLEHTAGAHLDGMRGAECS